MKLYELRDYIDSTAWPNAICAFVDVDEPCFTTGDFNYITGEVLESFKLFGNPSTITLLFFPSDSPGVLLTRDGILVWLDALIDSYGDDIRVKMRLYDPTDLDDEVFRDMLSDKMWGKIYIASDGSYRLSDGCTKAPRELSELEVWAGGRWGASQ